MWHNMPYLGCQSLGISMEVFPQIRLPRDACNLMDRLLCDVDDRLGSNGVQELKVGLHYVYYTCCANLMPGA